MSRQFWFTRFMRYYKSKGMVRTIWRMFQKLKELLFQKPAILFFVDLAKLKPTSCVVSNNFSIECFTSEDEIGRQDLNALFAYVDDKILRYYMEERFSQGALIWLAKVDGTLAGYIWSVNRRTIRRHYFPMTGNDVHLFDDLIFDEFRGRGINALLINYVLNEVKREGLVRAFIETSITNTSEIRSLAKTSFQEFGLARKYHIRRYSFVIWSHVC